MTLFLDLDGVLADFDRGVETVTGKRPQDLPLKTMWLGWEARGGLFIHHTGAAPSIAALKALGF